MYERPKPWHPPQEEPKEVTDLRHEIAQEERAWLQQYVNDPTIMNVDLIAAFTQISYKNARKLAGLAIRLHQEEKK